MFKPLHPAFHASFPSELTKLFCAVNANLNVGENNRPQLCDKACGRRRALVMMCQDMISKDGRFLESASNDKLNRMLMSGRDAVIHSLQTKLRVACNNACNDLFRRRPN